MVSHKGKSLTYGLQAFVAPTANVVGDVQLGELSSVWYGATVRGAFFCFLFFLSFFFLSFFLASARR